MTSPALAGGTQVLRRELPGSREIELTFPPKRDLWRGRGRRDRAREVFRTFAYVKFVPRNRGVQVRVTLRSHYGAAAFITVWIAFVALAAIAFVAIVVSGSAPPYNLVVPLLLLGYGISFIPLGRNFARTDGPALLDFVGMVISVR